MKKLISFVLLLTVLLSCCACSKKEAQQEATVDPHDIPSYEEVLAQIEADKLAQIKDPAEAFGHIDQTVPVDGVYKIWSIDGLRNMENHLDGTFELLCNIDVMGEAISTVGTADKPFTGKIIGGHFTISNLVIEANDDGYLGFIGVNDGKIENVLLKGVTYLPKANTKYMGGIAAVNNKGILRCSVYEGVMNVTEAAEGAVFGGIAGISNDSIKNCYTDLDLTYTAAGSATIGGIVGICENQTVEYTDTYGNLDITGSNKTVGLFVGQAKNLTVNSLAFLAEINSIDGKLFTNYFGTDEGSTYEGMWLRDNSAKPLPAAQQELRDRVVEKMNAMGLVEWHTTQDLLHSCTCTLTVCHGNYMPGKLHVGMPYNHKAASLSRFNFCMDEHNAVKDWMYGAESYDGFDMYIGNDCSSALQMAWWTVSNSTDLIRCTYMVPKYQEQNGCIPVGQWQMEEGIDEFGKKYTGTWTKPYVDANGEQTMYEAYALLRKGDAYVNLSKSGGHTRMVSQDAVVVRNENGLISSQYSYVLSTEQGAPAVDNQYFSSWRVDYAYTFGQLYKSGFLPVTMEELQTGEMEPVELKFEGEVDGKLGMVNGVATSNYYLDSGVLEIKDSQGNVVLYHEVFPTVEKYRVMSCSDSGMRNYNDTFDLSRFTSILQTVQFESGETYHYTVTIRLATGDNFVVKDDTFVNG